VIETVATRLGFGGRIVVRLTDGTTIDREFETHTNLTRLPGMLVIVTLRTDGVVLVQPAGAPPQQAGVANFSFIAVSTPEPVRG
jgi:hypothetical protein